MKLITALSKVVALLPKDDKSPFNRIKFNSNPSSVFVTDGINSSVIYVDVDLPDILCDASDIKNIIKNLKNCKFFEFSGIDLGFAKFIANGECFNIRCYPIESFPEFPFDCINGVEFIGIDNFFVNRILFSASKNNKNDHIGLPYIHITSEYIEATNRVILSRYRFNSVFPWEGSLPIELFNKWSVKSGKLLFYSDGIRVYFKYLDEIRSSIISNIKYPNTNLVCNIPSIFGLRLISNKKDLYNSVKQAIEVSPIHVIHIDFREDLYIKGSNIGEKLDSYIGTISNTFINGELRTGEIYVNGRLLLKAISQLNTSFYIVNSAYPNPLILFDDNLSIYLYPIFNE